MTEDSFKALLTEDDVRRVLKTEVALTSRVYDYKEAAEANDPSQVESMDSFYGLNLLTKDGTRRITLSVVDSDSRPSAKGHFEKLKSKTTGMQDMTPPIGDNSARAKLNIQGIGSVLVFIQGDKAVSLHTAQVDGQQPLVTHAGLTELAKLVASRL